MTEFILRMRARGRLDFFISSPLEAAVANLEYYMLLDALRRLVPFISDRNEPAYRI